jgi:hypothetical protein
LNPIPLTLNLTPTGFGILLNPNTPGFNI